MIYPVGLMSFLLHCYDYYLVCKINWSWCWWQNYIVLMCRSECQLKLPKTCLLTDMMQSLRANRKMWWFAFTNILNCTDLSFYALICLPYQEIPSPGREMISNIDASVKRVKSAVINRMAETNQKRKDNGQYFGWLLKARWVTISQSWFLGMIFWSAPPSRDIFTYRIVENVPFDYFSTCTVDKLTETYLPIVDILACRGE